MFCKCNKSPKDYPLKSWRIIEHQYTPRGYSRVICLKCGCEWIARAKYVSKTEDAQLRLYK